jgi:SAM-dependent methyltransferase
LSFSAVIRFLYHTPLSYLFPTSVRRLRSALSGCQSVLDLGCGPSSPLAYVDGINYSVGVEPYEPYVIRSREQKIHDEYVMKNISELDYPENSFDAVIFIGVLEHLEKEEGQQIIDKCISWAKKVVVITTPNGFIPQKALDGNPLQEHLSGWTVKEMRNRGFSVRGLCGLKVFRQEVESEDMGDDLLVTIRFRPKFFWFIVSTLSVPLTYFLPQLAFDLFATYTKRGSD